MLAAELPFLSEKRPLKKVRRSFLNKLPPEDEPTNPKDATSVIQDSKINILNPCLGLVELNGKVCMGTQFMNSFLTITSMKIENHSFWQSVTLNVQIRRQYSVNSWENSVARLEKSEDHDQVVWGQRIRKYYTHYPQIMNKYFTALRSNDPQVYIALRKAKCKARLICEEIESKYMYRKLLSFAGSDSFNLLSLSYSQGLLKEMGHTVDEFMEWAAINGLPGLFEKDCPFHLEIAKQFVECSTLSGPIIQEGTEYETYLYNKNGTRQKVTAQYINVLEPTADGMFHSGYFIVKQVEHTNPNVNIPENVKNVECKNADVCLKRMKEETEWIKDSQKCEEFEVLTKKQIKRNPEEESH